MEEFRSSLLRLQLTKKMNNLEEQLTSEEPGENVDATSSTVLSQQQTREGIISASAKIQKLGQMLMSELKRVSIMHVV